MNKTWKSLVALIAGGALAMSGMVGVSSALAINGTVADNKSETNTTNAKIYDANATLTINNVVQGDAFHGYQLLFLDSESADGKIYLVNDAYRDAIKAGIQAVSGNDDDSDTDAKIISWLTTHLTGGTLNDNGTVTMANTTNIDTFTAGFMGTNSAAATFTTEPADAGGQLLWEAVPVGFYLIEHTKVGESTTTDGVTTTNRTTSKYMAMNVSALEGASNTINLKNGTVTLDKTITNPRAQDAGGTKNAASYKVGDVVEYKLVGTLPDNFADFSTFNYTFTDVLSAGLTPPEASGVTVMIGDTTVGTTVTSPEGSASVKWEPEGNDGAHKLTVAMGDLKTAEFDGVTITKDSVIKVTYTAIVNKKAVITRDGNPNTAKVSFTRSPSSTEEADTPESKTTVYTFQLTLNKVDNKNKPLEGAEFTLYTEDGTTIGDPVSADKVFDVDGETVSSYTANFYGLAAGTYVIKETKTPAGYNTIDDITIKVEAIYTTDGSIASLRVTDARGNPINGFTATVDSGVISSSIVNNPGSVLPSTGGMGTVLLYTVGGLVVLIAAAGLTIALKRRQS